MIVCPKCSKENQDHYKFCLGCGSELPRDAGPQARSFSTPTPPAGIPVSQGLGSMGGLHEPPAFARPPMAAPPAPRQRAVSDFDEQEGTLAPPSVSGSRKCLSCGTENPVTFKFCGGCGARLDNAAAATAPAAPVQAPAGADGYLVLIRPDGSEGGSYALSSGTNVVGRDVATIFSADAFLSPRHASFELDGQRLTVRDEGSLNGIYVRIPAEKPVEVTSGDVVRLGQELVMIEALPEPMLDDDGTMLMGSVSVQEIWGRVSLVIGKDQVANAFCLTDEGAVLGRERGDVLFPDDGYVSGTHLSIQRQGDRIVVTDLNSSNGTFLRVNRDIDLHQGDYILMGQQLFRVDI